MTELDPDRLKQATQAYLYGYPLVYCLDEIAKIPAGSPLLERPAPFNTFGAARQLLGPDAEFVTPNNDTLYLIAALDLSGGPVVLTVPDTGDRYYVLQFVDAWSNNVAYVGTRATGNRAGSFLLAPTGYEGAVPDGTALVEIPTSIAVIVGRIAVSGDADVPAVHTIQDAFSLEPLDPDAPRAGIPAPADGVPDELLFWEKLRLALASFPAGAVDADFVANAATFGLTDETSPFVEADPELAALLPAARLAGSAQIDELGRTVIKPVNGWTSAMHAFDYNLDHLSLGTIDTPAWKIADRTLAYVTRAVAARLGLWGNHGYEAVYDILWTDQDGRTLDGTHRYELTLPSAPPTGAFWSFTMYDEPHYYLVANPIDRYAIGDRTEGLVVADDGSITLYLQVDDPGGDATANWLPAPTGGFRPVLRNYLPGDDVLAGRYVLPPIRRID
jgi:hypothetical protein